MSPGTYHVQYGDTRIEYRLAFAERRTLAIRVSPDLHITVTAPPDTELDTIAATVRRRAPWILRQQREFERYLPATPPRRYVSGETHRYLGRQYRLTVVAEAPEVVKLARGRLFVHAASPTDAERVHSLLDGWYQTQAERVFPTLVKAVLPRFARVGLTHAPELSIRPLETRWGLCTETGTVVLNLRLIQVPKPLIEYVVVHELCHLVEHNHSRRFYALLDRMLPDWKERRGLLNTYHVN
jgi:predicted metal-dependent hydrolase